MENRDIISGVVKDVVSNINERNALESDGFPLVVHGLYTWFLQERNNAGLFPVK